MTTLAFICFVIGAVCFALLWAAVSVGHLVDAGFFFLLLGLALDHLPAVAIRRP